MEDIPSVPEERTAYSDTIRDMLSADKKTIFYNERIAQEAGDLRYLNYADILYKKFCNQRYAEDSMKENESWEFNGEIICKKHDCGSTDCGGNGEIFYLTKDQIESVVHEMSDDSNES